MLRDRKLLVVLSIVLVFALGVVAIYYSYMLPPPSIEEGSPQISGHSSRIYSTESIEFLVIEGLVQNKMNTNARINVTVVFHDVQSNTSRKRSSPTQPRILKPQQKSPFTFYYALDSSEITYELDLVYVQTSEQPFDVLEFAHLTNQTEETQFVINGEIWNRKPIKAEGVVVKCAYYNAEGDFAGLTGTYVASIDAGGVSPFEIKIDTSKNPANYDLMAFAVRYENLSIANYVLFTALVLVFLAFIIFMKRKGW